MRTYETTENYLQQPTVPFHNPFDDPRYEKRSLVIVDSHTEDQPLYLPVRMKLQNNDHAPTYIPDNERFSIQSILGLGPSNSQSSSVADIHYNYDKAYAKSEKRKAYQKAYQKAYRKSEKWKAYRKSEKWKASQKVYERSEKRKAYRKAYRESEKWKAYQKAYQKAYGKAYVQSEKGKATQKAYQKAYYKTFKNTGDKEQAKIAGRQAAACIRESNKAKNNEL
ncbi:hypothetical protein [Endozoicomonas sp. YOMI1]|uniref:hypothetical protein n=1 Tax=Endozoicomonas sp. YOMI1 TaxID=2828739 RepID=UPI002148FF6B|nr:hypothetical protein [Endozoicomonas sp. YOMI1]